MAALKAGPDRRVNSRDRTSSSAKAEGFASQHFLVDSKNNDSNILACRLRFQTDLPPVAHLQWIYNLERQKPVEMEIGCLVGDFRVLCRLDVFTRPSDRDYFG